MNDVLSSLNIGREKSRVVCCIEGSIANDDVLFAFLHTFTHSITAKTSFTPVFRSTHYDFSKSILHAILSDQASFMDSANNLKTQCTSKTEYGIFFIDSINPLLTDSDGQIVTLRKQLSLLDDLFSFPDDFQGCCILFLPEELTDETTRNAVRRYSQLHVSLSRLSCIMTIEKPSGKVLQRCYQLNVKENDVLLREIKGDVIVEEQSTVHAKGYAESITVLSSTTNKAPELIIEEDEMDEDGDEDDDID
ncbi:hypothetical protein WA538_004227, partial [Blastocystis sp. DL]